LKSQGDAPWLFHLSTTVTVPIRDASPQNRLPPIQVVLIPAETISSATADRPQNANSKGKYMSLPGISSLSPSSLFNELASINNVANLNNPFTPTATGPVPGATPDSSTTSTASTSASGPLATDLAALLKSLGSNDVNGAKAALAKVEADIKADGSSTSSSSSTSGSNSTTGSPSGSQSTNPLTNLLNQLNTALNSGDTSGALQDLTTFLLNTGQGSGSAVNTSA
jgi:hypothetical protein